MDADREKFEQIANAPLKRHHIYTDQYDDLRTNELWSIWQAALAHRAAQPAGVEDAKRLDWLEAQAKASRTGISFDWCKYVEDGYVEEHGYRFMRRGFLGERKKTIRAAIDAASKGEAA